MSFSVVAFRQIPPIGGRFCYTFYVRLTLEFYHCAVDANILELNVLVFVAFQVHLQTQQKGNIGLIKMGIKVIKSDGIFGLYNGLTASLLRQVCNT